MADVPEAIQEIARRLWDTQQRLAVQVAERPPELREEGFAIVERQMRVMARNMGAVPEDKMDDFYFIKVQMQLIRHFVTQIYVGGSPQGGHA